MNEIREKLIEHPMEDILDIEPGTTVVEYTERTTELVTTETFDEKDQEIEGQFQEVYNAAMQAFDSQVDNAELVDPKYKALAQEVAVQFLTTALAAAKEKSSLKQHKDKINIAKIKNVGPRTLNQNVIVADRNDILKKILGQQPDET
jgi:hypothetical protein